MQNWLPTCHIRCISAQQQCFCQSTYQIPLLLQFMISHDHFHFDQFKVSDGNLHIPSGSPSSWLQRGPTECIWCIIAVPTDLKAMAPICSFFFATTFILEHNTLGALLGTLFNILSMSALTCAYQCSRIVVSLWTYTGSTFCSGRATIFMVKGRFLQELNVESKRSKYN